MLAVSRPATALVVYDLYVTFKCAAPCKDAALRRGKEVAIMRDLDQKAMCESLLRTVGKTKPVKGIKITSARCVRRRAHANPWNN